MKCPSDTSMHLDITERQSNNDTFFNVRLCLCGKYKQPVAFVSIRSERETITTESLLRKFAHQPLLSFAVWKTSLSCEINGIECLEKLDMTVDFSVQVTFITLMNQGLFLLFHFWRQGTASLEDCYFMSDEHKKRHCFINKHWLISTFLWKSKLNSLALVINNFSML